jgi:oligopeptidase B
MRVLRVEAMKTIAILLAILTAGIMSEMASQVRQSETASPAKPPVARRIPRAAVVHGEKRVDDYFYMREKDNPEVIAYLEAENAYTDTQLKDTDALREALYNEMLGRIKQTDLSVPYRQGAYFYYSRTVEGQQYPIMCRKKGSLDAAEEVILDVNELAQGEKFMALGAFTVSDDGNLLAFSTDNTGFRQYKLHVKDLRNGQTFPERMEKTVSVVWAADNRTLFYTVEDSAKRPYRLYRHTLGSDPAQDAVLYEEKDELYRISAQRTRSKEYIFLVSASLTTSEARYLRADDPAGAWKLMAPREHNIEYYPDHHGAHFYIRTNDAGRNFRLVQAPVTSPARANWKEVLPHRAEVMLEDTDFFQNFSVMLERENGLPYFRVTDLRTGQWHRVSMPEPAYSAFPSNNAEFDATQYRYAYQSLVTPNSVFDYDMEKRSAALLKQTEVLGGYDPKLYASERIHVTAPDGVKVPISLVYRKGTKRDGSAPMLLNGYGSYGLPYPVTFSSSRLSLLDRGMVLAIAHIRGGGEMGKMWHDQGRMLHKKNTFTDFIAAAEHLIAQKYTSKDRLAITGGSAGGLLMGAVTNMRPDLFKVVVSLVPFVDVINTMLDASLPLTAGEWEEWGNPQKKAEYDSMKTYCPYTNLAKKAYPAMLVRTSLNDSQVMFWEPAKYVARLRALKTDANPLYFKINMAAGHGGSSGRYDALRETAFDYAFMLSQLGLVK